MQIVGLFFSLVFFSLNSFAYETVDSCSHFYSGSKKTNSSIQSRTFVRIGEPVSQPISEHLIKIRLESLFGKLSSRQLTMFDDFILEIGHGQKPNFHDSRRAINTIEYTQENFKIKNFEEALSISRVIQVLMHLYDTRYEYQFAFNSRNGSDFIRELVRLFENPAINNFNFETPFEKALFLINVQRTAFDYGLPVDVAINEVKATYPNQQRPYSALKLNHASALFDSLMSSLNRK